MATGQISEVVRQLRRAVLLHDGAGLTDGQLLERFLDRHDAAALEVLVRRHGPMVWGVCRRLLRHHHDAEDAFQATFLVLVRRATEVVPPERVANWLYGVAYQTARKARATTARRRQREQQVMDMPEPDAVQPTDAHDLPSLLDQELNGLPAKYRSPIVLCDLEGYSRQEAARQLGVPEGTLSSQLTRGRALLAKRLLRRGLAGSGGAAVLSGGEASACVSPALFATTIQAANLLAAGEVAATGVIPSQVQVLMKGMLKTMLLNKFKFALVAMLAVVLVGTGVGLLVQGTLIPAQAAAETQAKPKPPENQPAQVAQKQTISLKNVSLDQVDGKAGTISVSIGSNSGKLILRMDNGKDVKIVGEIELEIVGGGQVKGMKLKLQSDRKPSRLVALPVSKDAKILSGHQQLKLSDLKPGMRAVVELTERDNRLVVTSIAIRK